MDQLMQFIRPEVVAAMVLAPIVLQLLRGKFGAFGAVHAALLNFVTIVGLVFFTLRGQLVPFAWDHLAYVTAQAAVAWLVSDKWYGLVVAPVAASVNPMIPANNAWAGSKAPPKTNGGPNA